MKLLKHSVLLLSVISISFFAISYPNNGIETQSIETIEKTDCKHGQCTATAKSTGKRCKHCVSKAGDTKCYQHKK